MSEKTPEKKVLLPKPNVAQRLLEVKKEITYIKKDAQGFNYTYASGESVLEKVNAELNKNGVILVTKVIDSTIKETIESVTTNGKKTWNRLFELKLLMVWVNVDDLNDFIEVPFFAYGYNQDEKGFGSALTYAERYFMLKQFNIPTGSDDPDARQPEAIQTTSYTPPKIATPNVATPPSIAQTTAAPQQVAGTVQKAPVVSKESAKDAFIRGIAKIDSGSKLDEIENKLKESSLYSEEEKKDLMLSIDLRRSEIELS